MRSPFDYMASPVGVVGGCGKNHYITIGFLSLGANKCNRDADMLDTVRLWTREFAVANKEGWRQMVQHDGLTGDVVSEAWTRLLPSSNMLKVRPNGGASALFYDVHSIPSLVKGSSLHELGEGELELVLEAMRAELKEGGIDYDENTLPSWRLSRVDFCRNIKTDHHAAEYLRLLELGEMPYMAPDHVHGQTACWRNEGREFTCYDKVNAEMDKGKAMAAGIDSSTPHHVVRIESRFKKARAIAEHTISKTTGEDGCKTLLEAWDGKLARRLLLNDFDKVAIMSEPVQPILSGDIKTLLELKERSRYFVNRWLMEAGMDTKLAQYGGDVELIRVMLKGVCSRAQVSDIVERFNNHITRRQPERARLLHELRDKLAA